MQPQKIILIPPTHEQSTPSFHVEGSQANAFLAFLESKGITAWQPPEIMGKRGPDHQQIVEIEIEAGTSPDLLDDLIGAFLDNENTGSLAKKSS